MNEKKFLDCANDKIQPCSFLGKEINSTRTWVKQIGTLKHVRDVLKQKLADIKLGNSTLPHGQSNPLSLQGNMLCQKEANGHIRGSWKFGLGKQTDLLFSSVKNKWKTIQPKDKPMKKFLEYGSKLKTFLQKVSMGDCRSWLEDFMVHWNKELEVTGN
ncbi:UL16-binding protein 1-like [Erinaceus europaeus]|uniref:UL16-binding protein 1-like n=1 Tax=Erinaceus europaeus TaxID=9365 RepID=A0ABM3YJ47_ERIEU|nr:UL16-binding protein 1-like [Erinaceus europaeus]